jgi:hypothetical protein
MQFNLSYLEVSRGRRCRDRMADIAKFLRNALTPNFERWIIKIINYQNNDVTSEKSVWFGMWTLCDDD